jgi:electron transport complex protein RnfC
MSHKFFGGVHPAEHKAATEGKPIVPMETAPQQVVLPMSMHVGAPCKPIVAVGDQVTVGQKIAEPAGLGAPIHATVSGSVVAVEPRPHPGGDKVMAVVIENDGLNTFGSALTPHPDFRALSTEEIVDIIREAGITGMGGAGFPTHVKLQSAIGKADTIIINAAECEPYITSDHRLMLEHPEEIITGVEIIMHAMKLGGAVIGVEDNKMDAVKVLEEKLQGRNNGVTVLAAKTRYPQGAEKQLIQRVTGRQVPPGKLPADVACAVFNVSTAYAIYEAVCLGRPLTQRGVTVSGEAVNNPCNLLVPIGTPLQHIVDQAGGLKDEAAYVLMGGPMMGIAQYDLSAPMIKGTNALTCMVASEHGPEVKDPVCIRCGKCVEVCPMHLQPIYINMNTNACRYEATAKYNVTDCIECGSCAYTCPAGIPLVQNIRVAKMQLRALAQKAKG